MYIFSRKITKAKNRTRSNRLRAKLRNKEQNRRGRLRSFLGAK